MVLYWLRCKLSVKVLLNNSEPAKFTHKKFHVSFSRAEVKKCTGVWRRIGVYVMSRPTARLRKMYFKLNYTMEVMIFVTFIMTKFVWGHCPKLYWHKNDLMYTVKPIYYDSYWLIWSVIQITLAHQQAIDVRFHFSYVVSKLLFPCFLIYVVRG